MSASPVILITGASKGIGRAAVVEALIHFNAKVVAIARNETLLGELYEYVNNTLNKGDQLETVAGDVTDENTLRRAVNVAIDKWGKLDSVVANAGVTEPISSVANASIKDWKKLYDINFFSVVSLVQIAIPYLRKSEKGSIILVSSGAALIGLKGGEPYGSSKAAINHLASTLAVEEPNIVTIAFGPGTVDTDMQTTIRAKGAEAMGETHTMFMNFESNGQLKKPEYPAHMIAALTSNPPKEFSGRMCTWNDEEMKPYRPE